MGSRDLDLTMRRNVAALTLVVAAAISVTDGLRFGPFPVTVDSQVLFVGRPSTLTCNYSKYRSEKVREITWFAGYDGIKMKFFNYNVATDTKEGSRQTTWIKADDASATVNQLSVTLPEFRKPNVTIGCEVRVLKDNRGGGVRSNKLYKEGSVGVADIQGHDLRVKVGPVVDHSSNQQRHGHKVATGQSLVASCISRGTIPVADVTMRINGNDITEMRGGKVDERICNDRQRSGSEAKCVTGYLDTVLDTDFDDQNRLMVECVAKVKDHLLAKKQLVLNKIGSDQPSSKSWGRNNYQQNGVIQGSEAAHTIHRTGRDYDAEVIGNTLLDMVDPKRHVHPGIPYDFYSGYLIVESSSTTVIPQTNYYGTSTDTTEVVGELPQNVKTKLEDHRGKFTQKADHHVTMKMAAVDVLNILGGLGYRVVGDSAPAGKMVWTLELKDYEKFAGHEAEDF